MKTSVKRLMQFFAMGIFNIPDEYASRDPKSLTPEEIKEIKKGKEEKAKQRKLANGLSEWTIDGITVIALNEKNAKRKVNNIKNKASNP